MSVPVLILYFTSEGLLRKEKMTRKNLATLHPGLLPLASNFAFVWNGMITLPITFSARETNVGAVVTRGDSITKKQKMSKNMMAMEIFIVERFVWGLTTSKYSRSLWVSLE